MDEKQERDQFLKRRRKGIGGSDVGKILGVDRYGDAIDVYLDKTTEPEDIDNPNMERGRMMEAVVSQKYMLETGRRLKPGKFRKHRKYPWLIGNPDRIIIANGKPPHAEMSDGTGVLELKTANRWVWKQIKAEGLPQSYLLQLQHYMGICGVEWGAFGVLCPDPWDFITFEVAFDPDLFEEVAVVLDRFWHDNVQRGIPPIAEPVDWGDAPEPEEGEEINRMDEDAVWAAATELLREGGALARLGEESKDHAKGMMRELMDEYGVYEGAGARVYFREQQGRESFMQRELGVLQPIDPIAMAGLLHKAGLDTEVVEALFEDARLDLQKFKKRGKPFSTIRMYDAKV